MTEDERIRAHAAQAMLGDPLFIQAMEAVKASAMAKWEIAAPASTGLREEAWWEVRAVKHIEAQFQTWAADLKVFAAKA